MLLTAVRRSRAAAMLLAAGILVQAMIAWYPYTLEPPRRVENGAGLRSDGSVAFSGNGARMRSTAPAAAKPWEEAEVVEVAMRVTPEEARQHGPARLLGIAHDHASANLMIGQEGGDLVVRARRHHAGGDGTPPVIVSSAFAEGRTTDVDIRLRSGVLQIWVDGEPGARHALGPGALATWDDEMHASLGDEVVGGRPWRGLLHRATVTVDGRTVDYLHPEATDRPERIWIMPDRVRTALHAPSASQLQRAALHLAAFAVLGGLAARGASLRVSSVAVSAVIVSLILQGGKVLVAGRHPSGLDVIAHALGALLGGAIGWSSLSGVGGSIQPLRRDRRRRG